MESKRCSKLVLNTSLFYPSSGGAVASVGALDPTMGTADFQRLNSTFTNLDFQQIIGKDMWEEFTEFNLVLVSATPLWAGGTPFGTGSSGNGVLFRASGLDWSNQCYDVYSKTFTNEATFLTATITNGALQMPVFNTCTFRRPAGNGARDFSIRLYRGLDNTQTTVMDRPAAFIFMFNIYGVDSSRVVK